MRIESDQKARLPYAYQNEPVAAEETVREDAPVVEEAPKEAPSELEPRDKVTISQGKSDKASESSASGKMSVSDPQDGSGALTKRLVAAKLQMEVMEVRSKAVQNLASLRMTAALGDSEQVGKAKAIIRKYEKLIRRAQRKISDLNKEDQLSLERERAQQQKKLELEREIARELRKRKIERAARERSYLREDEQDGGKLSTGSKKSQDKLDAAEEAKIAMQAQAQAAAEMSAAVSDASAGEASATVSGEVSTEDGGAEPSGEASGTEGGSVDALV